MLKNFVKAVGLTVALTLSGTAAAVGMGGINVSTALGEPLKAEVDLVAVGKADKNKLSIRLATPEAFKGAGLDYPAALPKLKFEVETRANGDPYIKVTSAQPINEPFVSLLLELTWSSGSLLREYTFLLDPPGFKPEQPKVAEVSPVAPSAAPLAPSTASADESKVSEPKVSEPKVEAAKEEPMPMRATAPMDEKAFVTPEAALVKKPVEHPNVASGTIKVQRGDTLSKIAGETKSPDVSLERMLVAMYRANENVFDGKNMNRLRTGKILRVPESDDLNKVAQMEAVKEIQAQAADWHAYRLKLAAASDSVSEQAPKQEVSGKISTTVADKAPAAKESAKEVVRLSKGEAPGDKAAAGGNAKALQDKLHAMEEEATAKSKSLKDSNERIAMLEKNIKELQRLIELKGQPVPPVQPAPSKVAEPATKPEIKPEAKPEIKPEAKPAAADDGVKVTPLPPAAQPASAVQPVKPAKPVAPKVVAPPPSLLDEIADEPLYMAAGVIALLGLGGIGFTLARRRSKGGRSQEGKGSAGTFITAPAVSSPDTGDFTQTTTAPDTVAQAESDEVDPISEADLFLNFGRDKQAEEILKDALEKHPDNQQIRLKLLSIYANRKDTKTFASVASEVRDSGNAAAWAQAAEMGRKLEPGNSMYGGSDERAATVEPQDETTTVQPAASLDFDLGFDAPETATAESNAPALDVPLEMASTAPAGLDLDIGSGAPAEAETLPVVEVPQESTVVPSEPSVLDFDLGTDVPPEVAPAPDSESGMGLPDQSQNEAVETSENLQTAQDTPLDFDITAELQSLSELEQTAEQAEKPAPSPDDLVFDVTAAHPEMKEEIVAAEETAAVEAPAPAEADMEFTLDFPVTEEPSPDNKEEAAKKEDDIGLSEINLNLDVSAPAPAPAKDVKDAHWHDVATKLDLARAYQEMGDASGAREILEEVLKEGDKQQRAAATAMMQQLSL